MKAAKKFVLAAMLFAWSMSVMAQGQSFTIPRYQAECLSALPDPENIINTDPVILRLGACPNIVAGSADLMGGMKNASSGLLLPKQGTGDGVLIMRRHDVVCLINRVKEKIKLASDTDQITVELSKCAGK